jgi:hypothetical protein
MACASPPNVAEKPDGAPTAEGRGLGREEKSELILMSVQLPNWENYMQIIISWFYLLPEYLLYLVKAKVQIVPVANGRLMYHDEDT